MLHFLGSGSVFALTVGGENRKGGFSIRPCLTRGVFINKRRVFMVSTLFTGAWRFLLVLF